MKEPATNPNRRAQQIKLQGLQNYWLCWVNNNARVWCINNRLYLDKIHHKRGAQGQKVSGKYEGYTRDEIDQLLDLADTWVE